MFNFKKKQNMSLNKEDKEKMEPPETWGYLNPLWKIIITHKGQELTSMPFCYMVNTYLKDYGFEPEKKMEPAICVCLDTGSGQIKMPLFIKNQPNPNQPMTIEYAREMGMVYKSHDKT